MANGEIACRYSPEGGNKIVIDFIDPLFAVALHLNFVEVIREGWFTDFRLLGQPEHLFVVLTIFLGYLTVVSSWIGYHQSVQKHQINLDSTSGQMRFFLDIVLLVAYFFLLVNFERFSRELWTLVFIFVIFALWDRFKRSDWPPSATKKADDATSVEGRGITIFWLLFMMATASLYTFLPPDRCKDWIVLFAMIGGVFLYRQHKKHRWFKKTIFNLGRPQGGA